MGQCWSHRSERYSWVAWNKALNISNAPRVMNFLVDCYCCWKISGKFPHNNVVEAYNVYAEMQVTDRGAGEVFQCFKYVVLNRCHPHCKWPYLLYRLCVVLVALADIQQLLMVLNVYKTRSAWVNWKWHCRSKLTFILKRLLIWSRARLVIAARNISGTLADKVDPNV